MTPLPPLTRPNGGHYRPRYQILFGISNNHAWCDIGWEQVGLPPARRTSGAAFVTPCDQTAGYGGRGV